MHDPEIKEIFILFKRLELSQLYKIEDALNKAIKQTEDLLEITEMDKARIKHDALCNNSVITK